MQPKTHHEWPKLQTDTMVKQQWAVDLSVASVYMSSGLGISAELYQTAKDKLKLKHNIICSKYIA